MLNRIEAAKSKMRESIEKAEEAKKNKEQEENLKKQELERENLDSPEMKKLLEFVKSDELFDVLKTIYDEIKGTTFYRKEEKSFWGDLWGNRRSWKKIYVPSPSFKLRTKVLSGRVLVSFEYHRQKAEYDLQGYMYPEPEVFSLELFGIDTIFVVKHRYTSYFDDYSREEYAVTFEEFKEEWANKIARKKLGLDSEIVI